MATPERQQPTRLSVTRALQLPGARRKVGQRVVVGGPRTRMTSKSAWLTVACAAARVRTHGARRGETAGCRPGLQPGLGLEVSEQALAGLEQSPSTGRRSAMKSSYVEVEAEVANLSLDSGCVLARPGFCETETQIGDRLALVDRG